MQVYETQLIRVRLSTEHIEILDDHETENSKQKRLSRRLKREQLKLKREFGKL